MTLRLGALHDALLDPGNAEKARAAAEELAGYDSRLASIDSRLAMLTALIGLLAIIEIGHLWLSFAILSRLP